MGQCTLETNKVHLLSTPSQGQIINPRTLVPLNWDSSTISQIDLKIPTQSKTVILPKLHKRLWQEPIAVRVISLQKSSQFDNWAWRIYWILIQRYSRILIRCLIWQKVILIQRHPQWSRRSTLGTYRSSTVKLSSRLINCHSSDPLQIMWSKLIIS